VSETATIDETALAEHRAALAAIIASLRALEPARWSAPRGPGKWSPAQIAEHLRLTYVTLGNEARGGTGFRVRAKWWLRPLLRLRYVGRILRTGAFPEGAPATREVRPGEGPFEREPLLAELAAEGERFLAAVQGARARHVAGLTHPFFGKLDLRRGLLLATSHLHHHHRQVPA